MKCPRAIPFLKPGLAIGAKRHEGFADAWNWLIHSFWHMTLGDGLKWEDKWHGYPKINLKIEAGEGINVDYTDGKVVISLGDGKTNDNESDGGGGEDPSYDRDEGTWTGGGDGGDGSGAGTHPDGAHAGGGGASGGDGMGSGGNGGGNGSDGADGDADGRGSSCNMFSEDDANDDDDPGMDNSGDDCAVVNGW